MKRNTQHPPYGPDDLGQDVDVSADQLGQLKVLVELLVRWQRRINLVSERTLPDIWRRHILDSAQLRQLAPDSARRWVDLGSGAGFPGLVTAILGVQDQHLVEIDARKHAFLTEAARATEVEVTLHRVRIEDLEPLSADIVTARALAPLASILPYAARHGTGHHTCLLPKGRNVGIEIAEAAKSWRFGFKCYQSLSDPEGRILSVTAVRSPRGKKTQAGRGRDASSPLPIKKAE